MEAQALNPVVFAYRMRFAATNGDVHSFLYLYLIKAHSPKP